MSKIKEWWEHLANDTKVSIIAVVVAMAAVVYFCGFKGNNDQNFWNEIEVTE